ncbi:MAG: glycosyltransferase [Candidatus Verstraetearchaeota archaeon]|jgi:hypothetical protein|nr:glycosyltransferase [Candidatus Verstraetearchaeota archaeon]
MCKTIYNRGYSTKDITIFGFRSNDDKGYCTSTNNLEGIIFSVIVPVKGPLNKKWLEYLDNIFPHNSEIILIGENISHWTPSSRKIILIEAKCNRSQARNLGLSICKGDLVFFFDIDQIPSKRLVDEAVELFKKGYDMIKVPERFIGTTLWGRASALWKTSIQEADKEYGCIPRIYSRRVFSRIGGFDINLDILEDFILYLRARKAGLKEAWALSPLYHFEQRSLREIIEKSFFYAKALYSLRVKGAENKVILVKYVKAIHAFIKVITSKEDLGVKICCIALIAFRLLLIISQFIRRIIRI